VPPDPECHRASFSCATPRAAQILAALAPELAGEEGMRSRAALRLIDETTIELAVTAPDIPSLRAALNMWLRLLQVADETSSFAERLETRQGL